MESVKIAQQDVMYAQVPLHAKFVQLQNIYIKDNVLILVQMALMLMLQILVHLALLIASSVILLKDVKDVNSASTAQVKYVHQYVRLELIQMLQDNVQIVLIIVPPVQIHQFVMYANLDM